MSSTNQKSPINDDDLRDCVFKDDVLEELVKKHGVQEVHRQVDRLVKTISLQLRDKQDRGPNWRKSALYVQNAGILRRDALKAELDKEVEARKQANREATASLVGLEKKWSRFAFELALELHAADPTALAALDGPIDPHKDKAEISAYEWVKLRLAQRQARGEFQGLVID